MFQMILPGHDKQFTEDRSIECWNNTLKYIVNNVYTGIVKKGQRKKKNDVSRDLLVNTCRSSFEKAFPYQGKF